VAVPAEVSERRGTGDGDVLAEGDRDQDARVSGTTPSGLVDVTFVAVRLVVAVARAKVPLSCRCYAPRLIMAVIV
jgi:hypothetical protein